MKIQDRQEGAGPARRGSALVLSLVAVTTVVVLAASFSQFASSVANRQTQAVHRKRAFYMAEAGLSEAFAGLTCGKSGNVGSPEAPALFGDGVFWVEATELGPGVVRLESTGMVGTGRAELALVAHRGDASVAALGAFSEGSLALAPGSLVDAYDSTKGAYASQADKSGAALGSNGDILVAGELLYPTMINGDVTHGPDGKAKTSESVNITGSTGPALAATELPPVEVPELALGQPQVHGSPYPLVISAGNVGYESLTIGPGAEVIIQGPAQVVLGSLSVEATAQLTFDTSQGHVALYVTDALELASGSILTTSSSKPEDVIIQVPGETAKPIALGATGSFHGVIFAPDASVTVGKAFELFGALVAESLTFEGAARLHFDLHLAQLAAESALPEMLSWRIVELASASTNLAADPFKILDVDKNLLPTPSQAHADQFLKIEYYDFSGIYHVYKGSEKGFDWSVVKSVIYAERDGVEVQFPRSGTLKKGAIKSPGTAPVVDPV
ncbi:MAG: hypothetical protein HOP15_15470 [Planctomycetes bacterium]|nr:hypothetical protein [Planctomycetota bacterium]